MFQEQAEQAQNRLDWEEAERHWRGMRTAFPDIFHAYNGGAIALCNLGRYDEARNLLDDAAGRFPRERSVPLAQGRLAMGLSDWPAAEAHWRTALTFDVRPWWVYTELAGALEHQGRIPEAEAVLLEAQARAEDPHEITLFTYPARLAWKREDWAAAAAR
jgi:Flp pilus assembly protein TadD